VLSLAKPPSVNESVADQRLVAKVNEHRVVLIVEPPAEDFETPVAGPGRSIRVPARQLLLEDLLAQVAQYVGHFFVRVTFGNEIDRRFLNEIGQANFAAGRIGGVEPVEERLLGLDHYG
jgi:hypothetical protein